MNDIPCENCGLALDTDKRNPVCLPCGHTVCKSCLTDIWRRLAYIKCPIDSKKHFLKLEDFPTNFLVQKLIANNGNLSVKPSTDQLKTIQKSATMATPSVPTTGKIRLVPKGETTVLGNKKVNTF